jgi:hypothetical protein
MVTSGIITTLRTLNQVASSTEEQLAADPVRRCGASGTRCAMSDVEHELIVDYIDLRERVDRLSEIAQRSLAAAADAQEAVYGRHEPWIDDAMRETMERIAS